MQLEDLTEPFPAFWFSHPPPGTGTSDGDWKQLWTWSRFHRSPDEHGHSLGKASALAKKHVELSGYDNS